MEETPNRRRLLFLPANDGKPTSRRARNKSLDSRVRRHLMVDIGKSRRKPAKDLEFVTLVWPLEKTLKAEDASRDDDHPQAPAKDLVASDTAAPYTTPYLTPPILYTLSAFEKEWGEDSFSAYGFTLITVAGKNAMGSDCSTNTFWFPFAFKKSAFLRHYQQVFTSADILVPLYRSSAGELRSLALERSLETIQCVESRLASSDVSRATSDSVIHAVLAMICYNFTSLDFDQALIHVKGMRMVISARGGISTLEANQDLMLMVSWVDITAALLQDSKPLFPLPANMASASVLQRPNTDMLPAPLMNIINEENAQDVQFMSVLSCLCDLNALATRLCVALANMGDSIWDDEEQMGFLINPVTHHLLNQQSRGSSEPTTLLDDVSEALRLGAIIWIIRVKRRCRSYPGTAQTCISKLLKVLSSNFDTVHFWNSSPDLQTVRLWLLVLCSISEPSDQDYAIAMRMIASDMKEQRSISWDETMSNVRQMPWIDIYEPPCAKIGGQLVKDYLQTPDRFDGACPSSEK